MSSLTIDPDLLGALEDLVKEGGRGKLFKGLGVGEIAGAFALPDQTASFAQSGLTSVERHILAVHRDELAFVLNSAFITNHHATPESGGKRFHDGEVLDLADLADHARRVRDHATPAAYRHGTLRFLAKICNGEPIRDRKELSSLTIASMRLIDTYKPRVYYAQNLMELGALDAARECLEQRFGVSDSYAQVYIGSVLRAVAGHQGRHLDEVKIGKKVCELAAKSGIGIVLAGELINILRSPDICLSGDFRGWFMGLSSNRIADRRRVRNAVLMDYTSGRSTAREAELIASMIEKGDMPA